MSKEVVSTVPDPCFPYVNGEVRTDVKQKDPKGRRYPVVSKEKHLVANRKSFFGL